MSDKEKLEAIKEVLNWTSIGKQSEENGLNEIRYILDGGVNSEELKSDLLHSVSDCKNLNIHECLNDLEKVIEVKIGVLAFIDKGSLRYQLKKAIDKMICCR